MFVTFYSAYISIRSIRIVESSYLHNGNSYTGKMSYWYWISPDVEALYEDNWQFQVVG